MKEENEKKIRRKRGRGRKEGLSPLPHPLVVLFFVHISLHCPHDLNAWNRLQQECSFIMSGSSSAWLG